MTDRLKISQVTMPDAVPSARRAVLPHPPGERVGEMINRIASRPARIAPQVRNNHLRSVIELPFPKGNRLGTLAKDGLLPRTNQSVVNYTTIEPDGFYRLWPRLGTSGLFQPSRILNREGDLTGQVRQDDLILLGQRADQIGVDVQDAPVMLCSVPILRAALPAKLGTNTPRSRIPT